MNVEAGGEERTDDHNLPLRVGSHGAAREPAD